MRKSIQQWFELYGESHQDPTNKLIHWVCVPTIFFCVVGLIASIPPDQLPYIGRIPWAKLTVGLVVIGFYLPRSFAIAIGMALWGYACLWLSKFVIDEAPWPLWSISLVLFAAAWIGQFIGHRIEGKKPSFLTDLQFLLIGPAWLMSFIYRRLGIPY
jgi:uncharacterized membrane protein YGL010W